MLPNDPMILLSYLNTHLRDRYPSFSALCDDLQVDAEILKQKLAAIDYEYDEQLNQFV